MFTSRMILNFARKCGGRQRRAAVVLTSAACSKVVKMTTVSSSAAPRVFPPRFPLQTPRCRGGQSCRRTRLPCVRTSARASVRRARRRNAAACASSKGGSANRVEAYRLVCHLIFESAGMRHFNVLFVPVSITRSIHCPSQSALPTHDGTCGTCALRLRHSRAI